MVLFRSQKSISCELNPKDGVSEGSIHVMERANG